MAEKSIKCGIYTPNGTVFEDTAILVVAPAVDGEIGIMPSHAPLISAIGTGALRVRGNSSAETIFAVSKGYLEVSNDSVSIIVNSAELAHKIDISRAETAKKRAEEKLIQLQNRESKGFQTVAADLERAVNRIHIGNKFRH